MGLRLRKAKLSSAYIFGRSVDIPTKVALEEHLFSSDINKTYANRLRLKQRIKQFYDLNNIKVDNNTVIPYDTLLKLEERIDIQLFRLN